MTQERGSGSDLSVNSVRTDNRSLDDTMVLMSISNCLLWMNDNFDPLGEQEEEEEGEEEDKWGKR